MARHREGREYKLQHLTTGDVDAYATIHMHPYLRDQCFDSMDATQKKEVLPKAGTVDPGRRLESIHDIQEGDFMYLPPMARLFSGGQAQSRTIGAGCEVPPAAEPGTRPPIEHSSNEKW